MTRITLEELDARAGIPARKGARMLFWHRVNIAGPDECWLYAGSSTNRGYGLVCVTMTKKRTTAHRHAYESVNGPFDAALQVCHKCDNPNCVNPRHLWLGTQSQNIQDSHEKMRQYRTRLSVADVLRVRSIYATGLFNQSELGRFFGVPAAHVCNIVHRRAWCWLKNHEEAAV